MFRLLLLFLCFLGAALAAGAQDSLSRKRYAFHCENCTVDEVFTTLSWQTGVIISFNNSYFEDCPEVSFKRVKKTIKEIIQESTTDCRDVEVQFINGEVIISPGKGQRVLSGVVQETNSKESIISAKVSVVSSQPPYQYTRTNEHGQFSLILPRNKSKIRVEMDGYKSVTLDVWVKRGPVEINLEPYVLELPPVVITQENNRQSTAFPVVDLKPGSNAPTPTGQADVVRMATEQAGVLTGVDGLGGFLVRGGNSDQNLVLLDDVPVYNPSHALGLFSVFNSDVVRSARLWKGDFPTKYGGRASSILDVRTREGNRNQFSGGVNANLMAASAYLEGPIRREQSSFMLSGRTTYLGAWIGRFTKRPNPLNVAFQQMGYNFWDFNAKINHQFNQRHRIYASWYQGGDQFNANFSQRIDQQGGNFLLDQYRLATRWGNQIAALRWNYLINARCFANFTFSYSRFEYNSSLGRQVDEFTVDGRENRINDYDQLYQTLIMDGAVRSDFTYHLSRRIRLLFGQNLIYHRFRPGLLSVNYLLPGTSQYTIDSLAKETLKNKPLRAIEAEIYGEIQWTLGKGVQLFTGLNNAAFILTDASYARVSPRIRLSYAPSDTALTAWATYNRLVQFMHQIGSFNIGLPFELWVPSTAKVQPQLVDQWSVGSGWSNREWSAGAEVFYRKMHHLSILQSVSEPLISGGAEDASGWEDRIINGNGYSRGVELTLQRIRGKATGQVSYTFSQSVRQFDDLNLGQNFPYQFDRPHSLRVQYRQFILHWLNFSASWTYMSGNPVTLARLKYRQTPPGAPAGSTIYYYDYLSNYRLPDNHRLDFAVQFIKNWEKAVLKVNAGVYNAYNRANPFYLIVNASSGQPNQAILYTLLPILPTLHCVMTF